MDTNSSQTRFDVVIFIVLLAAAVATRLSGLSHWHLMADEYYTFYDSMERSVTLTNPAYYLLTTLSFDAFGQSELSARLPAFLFGALSIPVFFLTWKRIIGTNAAIITAILILLSSWHLWYSQQARFYSAVFLFGLLAYYFFYRAIREDRVTYLVLGTITSLIAALFHLTAILIPAAFGIYCIVVLLFKSARAGNSPKVAKIFSGVCVVAGLAALAFLIPIMSTWADSGQSWGYAPLSFALQIAKYVQLPIVACALFGFLVLVVKDRWKAIFLLISIGVPVVGVLAASVFMPARPDYVFYILPLVLALAGIFCEESRQALNRNVLLGSSVTVILIVTMLPEFVSNYLGRNSLDFRDTIRFVEGKYEQGDQLMSFVGGFAHYSDRDFELLKIPGNVHDNSVRWSETMNRLQQSDGRTWIVLPISRKLPAMGLNKWLLTNARLVRRDTAVRFDYTHRGYEVFLVERE